MKRALIVALALLPLGCSFYYSSESSMKTLTSPSRSSGSSSGGDEEKEKEAYRDDVRDFTAAYAAKHEDVAGFASGLANVARRHGITDCEAEDATYTAVGAGLRRADVGPAARERYESVVGGEEPTKAALIRRGYGS